MAEFVESRVEQMLPELIEMERLKLFQKNEIQIIAKRRKEYEYKIQRHTKCKEDYIRYIHHEVDLLKLVKQRREKLGIGQKKSDIDFSIANRANKLYKQAIYRFQSDFRFWIAYLKFCKQIKFDKCVSRTLGRMLNVHQDKPKCWHIAAQWETEEKNIKSARNFLLRGLHIHPESQLLLSDLFKLELNEALSKDEDSNSKENSPEQLKEETPSKLKRVYVVYLQAQRSVKDIKFVIKLLDILKEFKNVEWLEEKLINDMVKEYSQEPLMWDVMARRELNPRSFHSGETPMEEDSSEQTSLRDRISKCVEVYQTAIKKLKADEMWALYLDFLIEMNKDTTTLPNFRKKLLKNALVKGHQAGKLSEEYYLFWIDILSSDTNSQKKMLEILSFATETSPNSAVLWERKLKFSLQFDTEKAATETLTKATEILGGEALPLWKLKLSHVQATAPEKCNEFFQTALKAHLDIAREMMPHYLKHTVLSKNIQAARKLYETLCKQPPMCLELHKQMAELELLQPVVTVKNGRIVYEMATLHFGKTDVGIWIDYINFESKHGDPFRVGDIYRRAEKSLEADKCAAFITQYSLLKNE